VCRCVCENKEQSSHPSFQAGFIVQHDEWPGCTTMTHAGVVDISVVPAHSGVPHLQSKGSRTTGGRSWLQGTSGDRKLDPAMELGGKSQLLL